MQHGHRQLIDIGVNLTAGAFRDDLDAVIERALEAGVTQMVVTGTTVELSRRALDLCSAYPGVLYATAGIHPHHAGECDGRALDALRALAAEDGIVAIGECGLDFNRNFSPPDAQREAFTRQLQLAAETGLPVFLHQRDAHEEFLRIFNRHRANVTAAVAHCFTGTREQMEDCLEAGMYIGITGWICDERRGGELQQAVASLPLERAMLETDAPYLLPRNLARKPVKAKRNEPCFLPHVLQETASRMDVSAEKLAHACTANTRRFFRI